VKPKTKDIAIFSAVFLFFALAVVGAVFFDNLGLAIMRLLIACVLATLVGGFILAVVRGFVMRKETSRINSIMHILLEECDPDRSVKEIIHLMNTHPKKNKHINNIRKNNLATGYFSSGEFDKAIEILKSIITLDGVKQNEITSVNIVANYSLCMGYLSKNDTKGAMPYIETLKSYRGLVAKGDYIMGKKNRAGMIADLDKLVYNLEAVVAIEEGDAESVLDHFRSMLSKAANRYQRVYSHSHLADIYEKLGDASKQREHLEYLAENGNMLYIARVAREKLELVN